VHACVRCALLAGAAPAPIPAPLPPLAAAGAAPTLIQVKRLLVKRSMKCLTEQVPSKGNLSVP
jgi:hypothetical protein